jgi:hypothetical protein
MRASLAVAIREYNGRAIRWKFGQLPLRSETVA